MSNMLNINCCAGRSTKGFPRCARNYSAPHTPQRGKVISPVKFGQFGEAGTRRSGASPRMAPLQYARRRRHSRRGRRSYGYRRRSNGSRRHLFICVRSTPLGGYAGRLTSTNPANTAHTHFWPTALLAFESARRLSTFGRRLFLRGSLLVGPGAFVGC